MKRSHRIFQDAVRLRPPAEMWQRIEAQSRLAPRGRSRTWAALESPLLRAAAVVVLAAGALIVAMSGFRPQRPSGRGIQHAVAEATAMPSPAAQGADSAQEFFDP